MTNGDVGAVRILRAILGAVSSLRRRLRIRWAQYTVARTRNNWMWAVRDPTCQFAQHRTATLLGRSWDTPAFYQPAVGMTWINWIGASHHSSYFLQIRGNGTCSVHRFATDCRWELG